MYALIHNNQIQVGPRDWRYSFFYSYLAENNLPTDGVTTTQPSEPIISEEWRIVPVIIEPEPGYEHPFDQLAGPFLTIEAERVVGSYNVVPTDLSFAKSMLKAKVTDVRYNYEVRGKDFTFSDGQVVNLYTSREDRTTYLDAFLIIPEGASVTFKFSGNVFRTVSKSELGAIVQTVVAHVQTAFDWENQKHAEIEAAEDMAALRMVDLTVPGV